MKEKAIQNFSLTGPSALKSSQVNEEELHRKRRKTIMLRPLKLLGMLDIRGF